MDTGRSRPPDPGGEASKRGEESSNQNGPPLSGTIPTQNLHGSPSRGIIQTQDLHGSPSSGIIQNQNQNPSATGEPTRSQELSGQKQSALQSLSSIQNPTPSATGASSGPSRQPKTGKQQSASVAGSRQLGSMARFGTGDLKAALPRGLRGTKDEMLATLRQIRDENDAARAPLTGSDKRAAPESRQSNEGRVFKRPQTVPPFNDFPFKAILPVSSSRGLAWVNFGTDFRPLFGSLDKIPGVSVKVAVRAGRMGDPSLVLTMSVNKYDVSEKISDVENEVSRFELIWEPYIRAGNGYRVQSFDYACAQDNKEAVNAVPEAREEILQAAKGNLGQVACIDMKVNGFRVSKAYEEEYWKRLEDDGVAAHQAIEASVDCFRCLENSDKAWMHLKFWFWSPCVYSEWERICGSIFKQCVDQRRPYLHQYGLREPVLDLKESPTYLEVGDGMYLTGKGTSSSSMLDQPVHLFPVALSFPTADAAMTVYGLCPIRAAQHLKGQSIFLNPHKCHVFLMPMASDGFVKTVMGDVNRPKRDDDPRTLLEHSFRAFIRIPNVGGIKDDGVLVPGLRFSLQFSSEAHYGEEEDLVRGYPPTRKGQHYHGMIISPSPAELHITGTTFAANLTRPWSAQAPQQACLQKKLQYLPNKDLSKAWIQAIPDLNTQKQELHAVQEVWKDDTEFVKTFREKIWIEKLPQPKMVDLMAPEDSMFDLEAHVSSSRMGMHRWSSDQQKSLRGLTRARDGISIIQGPPGTGKTFVLVEAVACLLRCNRKVQVIGPTNTSIDNVCTRIFETIQHWPELSEKIVLRIEAPSVREIEVFRQDENIDGDDIWQNPDFNQAVLHSIDQQEQEYKDLASKRRQKAYPKETSMEYNIRKLQYLDYVEVQKKRNPTVPLPKFEEVTIDQYCAEKESNSYEYSKLARQMRQTRGRPSGEVATQWKKLRLAQIARVMKSASCVIVTPHVAGRIANSIGFEADIVVVEEGGQLSVHSAMVPIAANSGTIKGLVLIGDHKQLRPVLSEGNNDNEWGHNARMSLEELLIAKEHPFTMLKTSYRLHRELCRFPSKEFYDNRLQPDPYADPNHPSRVAAREISRKLGIKRPFGCEYVVVDVIHGVARRDINGGTSLQNFASANAVVRVLCKLLNKGIPNSDITILNLYKGQHAMTQTKILQHTSGEVHFERLGGMSTIDAFQGKQSSIVLLDLVAAKERQGGPGTKELISIFAQEKNRINVAITRAKHALFVFGHGDSINATSRVVRGQEQSCLANLWNDARNRGLIVEDKSTDDHPEAIVQQVPAKAPPKQVGRSR